MTEITQDLAAGSIAETRSGLRLWPLFVGIALALYGMLYLWSENLVFEHGERNRFFMIASTPPGTIDTVILGASHAMPLGYDDFNAKLETASGGSVMNLSIEGGGILPNRLVLDYFFKRHDARQVVFFLDSFAFYSSQWNEDRPDSAMFARAPLDIQLVTTMAAYPWARGEILPYLSGFTKINNAERYAPDRSDAEINKFAKTYRPIPQIDKQRVAYLFPAEISRDEFGRYLAEFDALADFVVAHGAEFVLVKPPTPARYRDALPDEPAFDAAIAEIVARRGLTYRDFSTLLPGDENYYDTDHLNVTGVEAFLDGGFAGLLAAGNGADSRPPCRPLPAGDLHSAGFCAGQRAFPGTTRLFLASSPHTY